MLSFMFYDLTFLIIFSLAIALFLYVKRKKLTKDGWLFLYKTSIGMKLMDSLGKKYPRFMKAMSYVIVTCGYFLMAASIYLIVQLVYLFTKPELVKAIKVPPIMPLIPYLPELFKVDWLPPFYFTYWIIAIALVAIFHEGFHGIFAKFYNIRIKSTGFGFLGPFLAFFVEQDDKQMQKAKPFNQMTILAAGVFANLILAILFIIVMAGFFSCAYSPNGLIFNDYSYTAISFGVLASANTTFSNQIISADGINFTKLKINNENYLVLSDFLTVDKTGLGNDSLVKVYYDLPAINSEMRGAITKLEGLEIKSKEDLSKILNGLNPGDLIAVETTYEENGKDIKKDYQIKLGADYSNSSRAVLGIATISPQALTGIKSLFYKVASWFRDPNIDYEPKAESEAGKELTIFIYTLFWWLFWINLSVAIANMIPVPIFDGGRFFYLTILLITKKEKIAKRAFKISSWIILGVVALSMVLYFIGIF